MIKLILLAILLLAHPVNALVCNKDCGMGNCAELSYFLNNCAHCDKIKSDCSTKFCQNHTTLCDGDTPLHDLSISTHEITSDGKVLDVCMARLFPDMTLVGLPNGDLNINNLNTLDITTFAQTGGANPTEIYKRNYGIIKKLMANYLVYKNPKLQHAVPKTLNSLIEQELTLTYVKDIDHLTLLDFHTIAEDLRVKIYKLKGVDTQIRTETYEGKNYPMTVSKLGCTGEKSTTPLAHPPLQRLETMQQNERRRVQRHRRGAMIFPQAPQLRQSQ